MKQRTKIVILILFGVLMTSYAIYKYYINPDGVDLFLLIGFDLAMWIGIAWWIIDIRRKRNENG